MQILKSFHQISDVGRGVHQLMFAPDGATLATSGGRPANSIRLWDAMTCTSKGRIRAHNKPHVHFAYAGATGQLVSGAADKQFKVWECSTSGQVGSHTRHRASITAVASNSAGSRAVSGDSSGTVFSCSTEDPGHPVLFATVGGRVNSLAFAPGDNVLASGGGIERQSSLIHIWDGASGRPLKTLGGHSDWVLWVGFSPDGALMATGSYGSICLWDTASWKLLQVLERPEKERFSIIAFSFCAHKDVFITGGWSHEDTKHEKHDTSGKLVGWNVTSKGLIQTWNLPSGKLTNVIEAHDDSLRCLAHCDKSGVLASGGADGVVKLWTFGAALGS